MMNELNLDLIGLQTLEEFHDQAAAALDFPAYCRRDRDAFWDCITDFVEPTPVRAGNFHSLPDALRQALSAYIEMLNTYESKTNGTFSVLIDPSPIPDSPRSTPRG